MVNEQLVRQQRLEKFVQHLEEARKLQDDILKYGLAAADLYFEDIDGDWLERWGENEQGQQRAFQSLTAFLESGDSVAMKLRRLLKDKSLLEIAAELEKCLNLPEENNERLFEVKNLFTANKNSKESNRDVSDENNEIDLVDLAQSLLEKLANILEKHD
jgi:hypothetical protein